MQTRIGIRLVLIVAALATIGCDRVTKQVATATLAGTPGRSFLSDTVRLEYVENTGGFLSLGTSLPSPARMWLFAIGTGSMLLALSAMAYRFADGIWPMLGLTLLVAGGASNWIDRLIHGSVVDFLNVGIGSLRTGIFNVADVAIMLGVSTLMFAQFGLNRSAPNSQRLQ
jgi:signal peptidase II